MIEKKRGRPRLEISPRTKKRICASVASGKSLRSTLKADGMPSRTRIMQELESDAAFAGQYARARRQNIEFHIDSIIDLADTANSENAQAVRLKVDVRKWLASKLAPKVYGDRVEIEGGVQSGDDLRDANTALGVARRIAFVLAQGAIASAKAQAEDRIARGALLPAPAIVEAPEPRGELELGPPVERVDPRLAVDVPPFRPSHDEMGE
jgi:hypothetical protein